MVFSVGLWGTFKQKVGGFETEASLCSLAKDSFKIIKLHVFFSHHCSIIFFKKICFNTGVFTLTYFNSLYKVQPGAN